MKTKEKILDASFNLFLEKGYNVGINEIIKNAGISKGAVYHYFINKDDLFEQTMKKYMHRKINYNFVNDKEISIENRLLMIVDYYFDLLIENMSLLSNVNIIANLFSIYGEYLKRTNLKIKLKTDYNNLLNAFKVLFENYESEFNKKLQISTLRMAEYFTVLIKGGEFDFMLDIDEKNENFIEKIKNQLLEYFKLMTQFDVPK